MQRIFFVYLWANSKSGKTAALKAALSAWGNPETLMVSFNATQVGLERTAAFCCDLPLGIDERQVGDTNQDALNKIVYMVSNGIGKVRGTKNGGVQPTQQWRTVALATGEVPLSSDTSQTGVSTRVLEIYGSPFPGDDETPASKMHQQVMMDYGHAGPMYVKRIIALGDAPIIAAYNAMQDYVSTICGGHNGAHIASVAAVALADAMIDSWFFTLGAQGQASSDVIANIGVSDASWQRAKEMASYFVHDQADSNNHDVNVKAVERIVDWVVENTTCFHDDYSGHRLGKFSANDEIVYIIPNALKDELERAGYNWKKLLKYLREEDLIDTYVEKDGTKKNTIAERIDGKLCKVLAFRYRKAIGQEDSAEAAQAEATQTSKDGSNDIYQNLVPVEDEELPF